MSFEILKRVWPTYLGQIKIKAKKQQNEQRLPAEITHSSQLQPQAVCFVGGAGEAAWPQLNRKM